MHAALPARRASPPPGPRPRNARRYDGSAPGCWRGRAGRSGRRCRCSPSPADTTRRGWPRTGPRGRLSSLPPPQAPGRSPPPRRPPPPSSGRATRRHARNDKRDGPDARPPGREKGRQGSDTPFRYYSTKGSPHAPPGFAVPLSLGRTAGSARKRIPVAPTSTRDKWAGPARFATPPPPGKIPLPVVQRLEALLEVQRQGIVDFRRYSLFRQERPQPVPFR